MANILEVSMIEKIAALSELGWSIRRISRELGVHRDTVKKYRVPESKCTGVTAGISQSKCSPYDEFIRICVLCVLSRLNDFQLKFSTAGLGVADERVDRYISTVFDARNDALRGAHAFGHLRLAEAGLGAGLVQFLRNGVFGIEGFGNLLVGRFFPDGSCLFFVGLAHFIHCAIHCIHLA